MEKKFDRSRIQQLLDQNGQTCREFAISIGTSRQVVEHWLSGNQKPQVDMLAKIASKYGCSMDYFFVQENVCVQCTEQKKEQKDGGE